MMSSLKRLRRFFPVDCYVERGGHIRGRTWFDVEFSGLRPCFDRDDICYHTKEFWVGKTHIILDYEVEATDRMTGGGAGREGNGKETTAGLTVIS
ncbi:hypothetical protein [Sneathiella aquimaris]|uniref:hypothetical protein n=1 Tax=Sneathiella aquimaris TaxID=2599305 RepID=UPI00146F5147|nr:hypothetical protein [Sneathiella aquimaris]